MTAIPLHRRAFLALLAGLAAATGFTGCGGNDKDALPELEVFCAAALRVPLEEAGKAYEAAGLGRIRIQAGSSQAMLNQLEISRRGDIFLPADDSYVTLAGQKSLTAETVPLAEMNGVIAVAKGNPKNIRTVADLQKPEVRIVLADPASAAISRVAAAHLPPAVWDAILARATAVKTTVNEAANDVVLGAADAAIVWDVTARQTAGIEAVTAPELAAVRGQAVAAVTAFSSRPAEALKFLRWFASPEKGAPVFQKHGYTPVAGGDAWDERPTLTLMAGAMLRPAIDSALTDFEKREGCRVDRVYNGCGILVGQMKAGSPGDLFFACDASFMSQVTDVFPAPLEVSTNRLVILIPKGNPRGIRTLEDLGRPGLRIGIGHEKQCALGVLTQTTLTQSGWRDAVMKNVAVQAPTGDLLVNQLLTGALDAAVTYVSNAAGSAEKLEAIAVDLPCAIATQPLGIAKNTRFPRLSARLSAYLRSPESRARFEALGFGWKPPGD